jgi:ABC-2 type transport system permease protein
MFFRATTNTSKSVAASPITAPCRWSNFRPKRLRDREHEQEVEFQKAYDEAVKAAEEENRKEIENFEKKLQETAREATPGGRGRHPAGRRPESRSGSGRGDSAVEPPIGCPARATAARTGRQDRTDPPQTDLEILKTKNQYKVLAVTLPPIPPLLIGFLVFVRRRLREREGIARSRMR